VSGDVDDVLALAMLHTLADRGECVIEAVTISKINPLTAPFPRESIARDFVYRSHHIVRESYLLHSGPNHDRPTWDLTSVLYAVRPNDGYFDLSEPGSVSVADDGFTTFTETPNGRDRYLKMNGKQAIRVIETQRALVSQPPMAMKHGQESQP
jgi:hypothetical protein